MFYLDDNSAENNVIRFRYTILEHLTTRLKYRL